MINDQKILERTVKRLIARHGLDGFILKARQGEILRKQDHEVDFLGPKGCRITYRLGSERGGVTVDKDGFRGWA